MRPKDKQGKFQPNFDPYRWGDHFMEGNSWQYTWFVPHDVEGLQQLMGGKEGFFGKLDSVFSQPQVYDISYYKRGVIHLIREMQNADMGQYAHLNEPMRHVPYLYAFGQPWKTQAIVRRIMDKLYKPTPDGYCGDEDNGQMSAWYVFSAMGFYPLSPVSNEYVLGSPIFEKAEVKLPNGKILRWKHPAIIAVQCIREFGLRNVVKKLVISLYFCNFISDNQLITKITSDDYQRQSYRDFLYY